MPAFEVFLQITHLTQKKENINIVASEAKIQLHEKFQNHVKIFTDGSVATSGDSGFVFLFFLFHF